MSSSLSEDPWRRPAFLDHVHPRPLRADIDAVESTLGVTLPAPYLRVLQVQNGGYTRGGLPNLPHRRIAGLGVDSPHLGRTAWWHEESATDVWAPNDKELLICFDGEGHWDLCFDFRSAGPHAEPTVAYVDNEMMRDEQVAGSFDDFLAQLVDEDEAKALRVYATADLDEVAGALAAICGAALDDQGAWNNGYRTLRLKLPGGGWAWLWCNDVPAGFRRNGREVIVTEERTLYLPTDPDCKILVRCSDEAEAAVRHAAATLGLVGES